MVNGVFLVALCLSIFLEAIQRFVEPQEVSQPKLVLIVGCFGLASNILGLVLFHDHSHGHDHGHEQETQDGQSAAEQGQAANTDGGTNAITNPSGNVADVLPQTVVGAWPKLTLGSEARNMTPPRDFDRSDEAVPAVIGSSPRSVRRKTSSASGSRHIGHRRRRSGSHARYSSIGEAPVHLHPASFRNEIIAAGRLEEIESAPSLHPECGAEENIPEQATEETPILDGVQPKNYVNGTVQEFGHTSHKHRQPKCGEKSTSHSHADLNIRGIFLHVMGDALGNIGVIATALVIWLTDFSWRFYFDPFISLVITVIILLSAIPLCRAASRILLQAVPAGLEIDDIREDIESLEGVVSCHHLHVWQLSDTKLVASLHIQLGFDFEGAGKEVYMRLAKEVRTCLHEYGIHSSTIQPEFCLDNAHDHITNDGANDDHQAVRNENKDACLLDCDEACIGATCCTPATATHTSRSSSHHRP